MGDPLQEPDFEPLPPEQPGEGPAAVADPNFEPLPSLDEVNAQTDARVQKAFEIGAQNPERRARVLAITKQFGVPSNIVDAKLNEFELAAKAARFDPAKLRMVRPELVKLMVGDPEVGALAVHDEPLGLLHRAINYVHDSMMENAWRDTHPPEEWGQSPEALRQMGAGLTGPMKRAGARVLATQYGEAGREALARELRDQPQPVLERTATAEQQREFASPVGITAVRYYEAEKEQELSQLNYELAMKRAHGARPDETYDIEKRIADTKNRATKTDFGEQGIGTKFLAETASQAAPLVGMGKDLAKGGGIGAVIGAGLGGALGAAETRTPVGAVEGATAGAELLGRAGAGAMLTTGIFKHEVGSAYGDLEDVRTDGGKPLTENERLGAAALYGTLATAIQVGALGKMFASAGEATAAEAVAGGGGATLKQLLKQRAFRELAARAAKELLTGGATMGAQSGLTSLTKDAVAYFSKSLASGRLLPAEQRPGEFPGPVNFGKAAEATQSGFVTGLFLHPAMIGAHALVGGLLNQGESQEGAEHVNALAALKDSPTAKASPESVAQMITDQTAKTGRAVTDLYVDPKQFVRLFQAEKVDLETAATDMLGPDGAKQLGEALQSGGKLKVPLAKYVEKWSGTEVAAKLAEYTVTQPDLLTPPEVKVASAETKEQLDKLREQATVRNAELEIGKKEVYDYIRDQAVAAGIKSEEASAGAKLVSESAVAFAANTGMGVREAAALSGIGQLRILGPKGELVAAKTRARFASYLQPEASTILAKKLASIPPEEQAAYRANEYFVDPVSGLRNRRAWDATERQPGKQVVAITSPDVKGINDHPTAGGHDVANDLLRAMGAAVFQADPEGARSGTNFLLHVEPGQLDQVLAKVKTALGAENLNVVGAAGGTTEAASKALDAEVARRRGELKPEEAAKAPPLKPGEALPARGALPEGLDVAKLSFGPQKGAGSVPEALAQQLGEMPAHEYARLAYLDRVDLPDEKGKLVPTETGLLTAEGYRALPKKAHQLAIDAKNLKLTNDRYGKETGNRLLFAIADTMKHFGGVGFDVAHLSGDEYVAQHNDPIKLREFADRVRAELKPFEVKRRSGKIEQVPVDFRYGLGRDYAEADRDLNAGKRAEGRSGGGAALPGSGDLATGNAARGVAGEAPRAAQEAPPGGRREVTSGVGAPGQSFPEAQVERARGEAFIGRMTPANRIIAQAFLDYVDGLRPDRPQVPDKMLKELAKFGIAEGYGFDEYGRSLERGLAGARRKGESNLSIGEKLALKNQLAGEAPDYRLKQEPLTYLDGAEVTLNAGDPKDPRGFLSMRLSEGGQPVQFDLQVLRADKSTFLHELGHFLSHALANVATSDVASESMRRDYDTLLKWAGWDTHEQRLAETIQARDLGAKPEGERTPEESKQLAAITAKEEKISHGWEQYLSEGKAPNRGLAKLFSRFKGWLVRIYKGLNSVEAQYQARFGQPLALSDDVRKVFDRVLAESDALDSARQKTGQPQSPPPLITAGMSPFDRKEYVEALVNSRLASEQELARAANHLMSDQEALAKTREQITAEVTQEHDKQPLYRASRFLQRGELVDADGKHLDKVPEPLLDKNGQPFKVDRADFIKKYDRATARDMPPGIFAPDKQGVPIDELAPLLGFDDGQKLVTQLRYSPERDASIAKEVQGRIDDQYKPALRSLADLALSAVHNDAAAKVTLLGIRALAKQVDPRAEFRVRSVDLDLLKTDAARRIGDKTVSQLDPELYAKTERKLALDAARVKGKGEKAKALELEEQKLHNQLLYSASADAQRELEQIRTRLAKTSDAVRASLGLADPAYRDVHDAVLGALGLGPELPEGKSVEDMLTVATDAGQTVPDYVAAALRDLIARPKAWESLTVDQARDVADAITNLRHNAKEALDVKVAGKTFGKAAFLQNIADAVKKARPKIAKRAYDTLAAGFREKAAHVRRAASALLENAETWAEMMDGGTNGPMHDLLVNSRIEARTKEVELTRKVLLPIMDAWEKLPKDVRGLVTKRVDGLEALIPPPDPSFAPKYTNGALLSLFLNWGNEGNRQRIRDGNKWTDENVQKALNLLPPELAKFGQTVLDVEESLYPELSALHERTTGLKLGKVEATPITVNGVEFRGGYHPLRYDARISQVGVRQEVITAKDLAASSIIRPSTARGHTKARVDQVNEPVLLDWSVVPAHLSAVVHDIAYREWIKQTGKILLDKTFGQTVDNSLGPERTKEFKPWLADVANARADSTAGHTSEFQRMIGPAAQSALATKVMALNAPALIRHSLDPFTAMADSESIPPQRIAASYAKVINPGSWDRPEYSLSKEIGYHEAKLSDDLRGKLMQIVSPKWKTYFRANEVLFKASEFVHHFTTRVAFTAAYDDAIAKGATSEQAAKRADDVLRRHFPSGDLAELPRIMRTKYGLAGSVLFYGYASKMYNLRARSFDAAWRMWNNEGASARDKAGAIAKLAGKWLAMSAIGAMGLYAAGRGPKKDDDPAARAEWLGEELVLNPLDEVALAGPMMKKALTGHKVSVASAPELTLAGQALGRFGEMIQRSKNGNPKSEEEKLADYLEFFLSALGPTAQVQRTGGYVRAVRSGDEEPRGPLDVVSGALVGKGEGATPLTDFQSKISGAP